MDAICIIIQIPYHPQNLTMVQHETKLSMQVFTKNPSSWNLLSALHTCTACRQLGTRRTQLASMSLARPNQVVAEPKGYLAQGRPWPAISGDICWSIQIPYPQTMKLYQDSHSLPESTEILELSLFMKRGNSLPQFQPICIWGINCSF